MFSYKIFRKQSDVLLAVCDTSILGKRFEQGDLILEINKDFYSGNKCDEKELKSLAKNATIINAAGEKTISLLEHEGIIGRGNILRISGIPHAQIVIV